MRVLPLCACLIAMAGCGSTEPGTLEQADAAVEAPPSRDAASIDAVAPVSPDCLVMEVKGLINTVDEVNDVSKTTFAMERALVYFGGEGRSFDEDPVVFYYRYPDDYADPAYRGREVVVIDAYREEPSTMADYHADMVQVILPVKALTSGQASLSVGPSDGVSVSVRRLSGFYRADKVTFVKDCYLAVTDKDVASSAMTLETTKNTTFVAGENLMASANLALETDPAALAALLQGKLQQVDGAWCSCTAGGKAMDCANWEEEISKDVTSLSCEVPVDYYEPTADKHAVFRFKGRVNGATGDPEYGTATFDVSLGSTDYGLEYSSYAARATVESGPYAGKDYIAITSLGGVKTVSSGRYKFNYMTTSFLLDTLTALKASSTHEGTFTSQKPYFVALYDAEQADIGQDMYVKLCPRAVGDLAAQSSIWLCYENNVDYSIGESLEVAGNIPITDDASQTGTECACYESGATLDCAQFPQ